MIERYSLPDMDALFSDVARFSRYLEIELHALDAQATLGVVPAAAAAACRARAPQVDAAFVQAVSDREAVTNHDVAAFVDVVQERIGGADAAWVHHGLTSSDVVDTAWCAMLRDAGELIDASLAELIVVLVREARTHRDTPMIGRTHGMHAEPTTFGAKVALWALQVDRDRRRMKAARFTVAVCKLSGAVGTYSNIDPRVEEHVAKAMGLRAVPATQVVSRDRHAEFLSACASTASTVEMIAVELRHLQRTEVSEVREGFAVGQKGSSAMPHKRNPISAETLTGLARVVRGNLQAGLQNVALWHERDISHSSVERIILPDTATLTCYMVRRLTRLVASWEVDVTQMRTNLDLTNGAIFSQSVLLALVEAGLSRDAAYRLVQESSRRSHETTTSLRQVLSAMPDVAKVLGAEALSAAFDVQRVLRHAGRAVDALNDLGG
ncbi:MAG: adenylosuccinate lyase [Ilumatobacteraceae bacterium]|nr:adenylosuccinate lyase [Ilumatobacteraceae bacterium]